MKKILITGANGFIGSALSGVAVSRGFETHAGIRPTSNVNSLNDLPVRFFRLDFTSQFYLEDHLKRFADEYGKFDYIIHNAGITKAKKKEDFNIVNSQYTKNFIDALIKTGTVPEKFIYMSSLAAFGPSVNNEPIRETDTPNPITLYGKSKLSAEQYIISREEFPSVIIRPAAVYGPRDTEFLTLVKVINNGIEPYLGNKQQLLSFIHVSDLAEIVIDMLNAPPGSSYFISDGNSYTNMEFNSLLKKHLHKNTISVVIPDSVVYPLAYSMEKFSEMFGQVSSFNRERLKEFRASNWSCDTASLNRDMHVNFKYDLDSGLRNTINWYRKEGWVK